MSNLEEIDGVIKKERKRVDHELLFLRLFFLCHCNLKKYPTAATMISNDSNGGDLFVRIRKIVESNMRNQNKYISHSIAFKVYIIFLYLNVIQSLYTSTNVSFDGKCNYNCNTPTPSLSSQVTTFKDMLKKKH